MRAKVIVDRQRHTALLYGQTPSHLKVIRMHGGMLTTSKMTEEELTAEWADLVANVEQAAAVYLHHQGGMTDKVREILHSIKFFGEY